MNQTTTDTITNQAAYGAVLAGVLGVALGGWPLGAAALVSGVAAWLNLAAHRWISTQVVAGNSMGALYGLKLLPTVLLFFLLFQFLSPLAVALGLASVLMTAAMAGASQGLREASA